VFPYETFKKSENISKNLFSLNIADIHHLDTNFSWPMKKHFYFLPNVSFYLTLKISNALFLLNFCPLIWTITRCC